MSLLIPLCEASRQDGVFIPCLIGARSRELSISPMQLPDISREIFIEWPVPIDLSIVDCNGHLTLVSEPAGQSTPPRLGQSRPAREGRGQRVVPSSRRDVLDLISSRQQRCTELCPRYLRRRRATRCDCLASVSALGAAILRTTYA